MEEIIRIVIKGASGFCYEDKAYEDKLTLTSSSISYECKPEIESKINPKVKWSYKTSSELFKIQFEKISKMLPEIIENDFMMFCDDAQPISFIVTYSDKTRIQKSCFAVSDYFEELCKEIKVLCPSQEETPKVIKTSEDYED